jgi:hypothetical protein
LALGSPAEPAGAGHTGGDDPDVLGFAVPLELGSADADLCLITTLTSFATADDVTLAELSLEAVLPADEHTADVLRRRWG